MEFDLSTSSLLVMEGFVVVQTRLKNANSILALNQTVSVITHHQQPNQVLGLTQSVVVTKAKILRASNFLSMNQVGVKVTERFLQSLLQFTQTADNANHQYGTSFLNLSQLAIASKGTNNLLVFTQTASCNFVKNLPLTSVLTITGATTANIDGTWQFVALARPASVASYNPKLLAIPPSPAYPVPISFIGTLTTLTFPNVDFGNSDRIEHTRISRRTIGEELMVYRDPRWPITETLKFKIIDLTASDGKAILQFLSDYLAQQIEFVDWLGVHWTGVITNPETMLTQPVRDQLCSGRYEIEIEFQGVQKYYVLSETTFSQTLNLAQTVVRS